LPANRAAICPNPMMPHWIVRGMAPPSGAFLTGAVGRACGLV
jgi:hypothetical protein